MAVSKRLLTIVDFVPEEATFVADIGSDHGLVPLELLKKKKKIFASDNKKGPFLRLKNTLGTSENVQLSLSWGLEELPLDVDTVILSGLGGNLILEILEKGKKHFSHIRTFILSPQGDEKKVRQYFAMQGYKIQKEAFLKEDGIYYTILCYQKGEEVLTEKELRFGPWILKEKNADFREWIQKEILRMEGILEKNTLSEEKRCALEKEKNILKEIL